ncbi:hypothetical protein NDU88_006628 [Pleurodeles waltl]|uniref:Secreted protein n=1 Tax=Pleurodeles waltl TaxID=8319 RepID=A0AAV7SQ76_PLEWA|nr:hypothetical protein NDU88_006628 [Pleurodeles waltl]
MAGLLCLMFTFFFTASTGGAPKKAIEPADAAIEADSLRTAVMKEFSQIYLPIKHNKNILCCGPVGTNGRRRETGGAFQQRMTMQADYQDQPLEAHHRKHQNSRPLKIGEKRPTRKTQCLWYNQIYKPTYPRVEA